LRARFHWAAEVKRRTKLINSGSIPSRKLTTNEQVSSYRGPLTLLDRLPTTSLPADRGPSRQTF
jgi:hypothetical protein